MNNFFEDYDILYPADFYDLNWDKVEEYFDEHPIRAIGVLLLLFAESTLIMSVYYITIIPWLINEWIVWYNGKLM